MSRTYRKDRKTKKIVRDGTKQYVSVSCEHHGGCPWCENNRQIDKIKTELWADILKNEYYDILTTEDCLVENTPSGVKAT